MSAARDGRCYPFGGSLFHVIGDWNTQRNWAASNTSFIERDTDRDLRGYDDGAKVIEITNARTGGTQATIRRDYRALVPLVRHRYEPDHPDGRRPAPGRARCEDDDRRAAAVAGGAHAGAAHPRAPLFARRGRRDGSGERRRARVGQLSVAVEGSGGGERRGGREGAAAARSRALRVVSAGIDVQAGDRDGGAASGSVARADGVRVPSSAGFARRASSFPAGRVRFATTSSTRRRTDRWR